MLNLCFLVFLKKCSNCINTNIVTKNYVVEYENNIGRFLTETIPNLYLILGGNGTVVWDVEDSYTRRHLLPIFEGKIRTMENNKILKGFDGYKSCFSTTYGPYCWFNLNNALVNSFEYTSQSCGLVPNNTTNILIVLRQSRKIKNLDKLIFGLRHWKINYIHTEELEKLNICEILKIFNNHKYIIGNLGSELTYSYFLRDKIIIAFNSYSRLGDIFFVQLCETLGNTQYEIQVETTNYWHCKKIKNADQEKCNDFLLSTPVIDKLQEIMKKEYNNYNYFVEGILTESTCCDVTQIDKIT